MHHAVVKDSSHCNLKCEEELVASSEPVSVYSGILELIYTLYDKQRVRQLSSHCTFSVPRPKKGDTFCASSPSEQKFCILEFLVF